MRFRPFDFAGQVRLFTAGDTSQHLQFTNCDVAARLLTNYSVNSTENIFNAYYTSIYTNIYIYASDQHRRKRGVYYMGQETRS